MPSGAIVNSVPVPRRNTISIIDDDESIGRTTKRLIESFGFRAAAFASAETFLTSCQLDETACLIVDVRMPGMSGLELQRHLAQQGGSIPIIFITSYEDGASRAQALEAGAVAVLGKPFNDHELLETIHAALQQRRAPNSA